jgi:hypothetical protein
MEEMSKKTKRLEKENSSLTRKHDATNQNIIKMAEERTRAQKELEQLRKRNENLEKLCRGMQAQGRGVPPIPPPQEPDGTDHDDDGTESEYDYSDEEDDGSLDEDEYEDSDGHAEHPISRTINKASLPNGITVKSKGQSIVGKANAIKA